jgi:hypothetical protein
MDVDAALRNARVPICTDAQVVLGAIRDAVADHLVGLLGLDPIQDLDRAIRDSESELYPKLYEFLSQHTVAIGIACLLADSYETLELWCVSPANNLGRQEQEQLGAFLSEAHHHLQFDQSTNSALLQDAAVVLASGGAAGVERDRWLEEVVTNDRLRAWYTPEFVRLYWISRTLRDAPAFFDRMTKKRAGVSPSSSPGRRPASAGEWPNAVATLSDVEMPWLREECPEAAGFTVAQVLTCTQPNWQSLWSQMPWSVRIRTKHAAERLHHQLDDNPARAASLLQEVYNAQKHTAVTREHA